MNSVTNYARQWTKREREYMDTISEWAIAVRSLIQIIIKKKLMGTRATSIFKYLNVAKQMHLLHDQYFYQILTAFNNSEVFYWFCRKSPNNIIFVCKSLDTDYLLKELCINNSLCNPIYLTTHTVCSFGILDKDKEPDLLSLFWIPK
jgi:hypothetical protein